MNRFLFFACTLFLCLRVSAQKDVLPTPASERMNSLNTVDDLKKHSLVKNVPFRNVGPTIMSGRVVDVDVNPMSPSEFYVAYASGGLWYTRNNGLSFTPVFDHESSITIGEIAVDWKSGNIWVGTGEVNSSRSSYAGTGIFLSTDSGKTWVNKGLPESHHIGKILFHPTNKNILWVAVLGHLYTPNKERGVYKSTDGGNSWTQVLYVDDNSGAVDLAADPSNPDILYACIWHRERRAWNLMESGSTSGIYKSIDGGDHWNLITGGKTGFPATEGTGRIGVAVCEKNPSVLYAVLDNQDKKAEEIKDTAVIEVRDLKNISKEDFLKLDDKKLESFLRNKDFPEKYSAVVVKDLVRTDSIKPQAVLDFLNDANNSLFDSPIIGAEIYRSDDAGKSWKKTHTGDLKKLFFTYGYYFGRIYVSPFNEEEIVICGYVLATSKDGGKTFSTLDGDNTHPDYHVLWMSHKDEGHIITGNDGGLNISYDGGKNWFKANSPPVGQFYSVAVDLDKPYNVYGGLQDNGVWTGPSTNVENSSWHQEGIYPFRAIMGGDGMQVQVDDRDNSTVYSGFQFGNYFRINKNDGSTTSIRPVNDLGEPNYRLNWQTPIWLSTHNRDILYFGSNHFHRSMNKGESMKTLSGDLTLDNHKGDVPFNTITSICESTLHFGLIYAGTDDGLVWISRDVGYSFSKISGSLPAGLWVSRVAASKFVDSRVYLSLSGYRYDNFKPYVFASDDYGTTWQDISANLPSEPINVIKEDPSNEKILYVGTDNGIYISIDRGRSYMAMSGNLPRVAVHDLVIHPRDEELVLGTHGRSIYIASLAEIHQLNDSVLNSQLYVFKFTPPKIHKNWGNKPDQFSEVFQPSITIPYYSKEDGLTTIRIKSDKGILLKTSTDTSEAGLNYFNYGITLDSTAVKNFYKSRSSKGGSSPALSRSEDGNYYLPAGSYVVEIENVKGARAEYKFELLIKEDH